MSNRHLEKYETIVIDYGHGLNRWIGSWQKFRFQNPTATIHNVETLYSYKKRIKPLNNENN
jgi:hypothetical protein